MPLAHPLHKLGKDMLATLHHLEDGTRSKEQLAQFGASVGKHIGDALAPQKPRERLHGKLWASDLGAKCTRRMWYKFNQPHHAEELADNVYMKFLWGNMIEEMALVLVEAAHYPVSGEQERYEMKVLDWAVSGKQDAVIDGVVVDVKSTSSFGFKRYTTEGVTEQNDSFGYREQLSFYHGLQTPMLDFNPSFLFIDKQLGHIASVPITPIPIEALHFRADLIAKDIEMRVPPSRMESIPEGKSGNKKLCTHCSYCEFKQHCWPGLRTFSYSHGPVFLTDVNKLPKVREIVT